MIIREGDPDGLAAGVAAAIGVTARARMLFALLGGHARTSTELAVAADVSASTASIHLALLRRYGLVRVTAEGKRRWYSLAGKDVAQLLETLSVVSGSLKRRSAAVPHPLRIARSCYDHLAGRLGVALHDEMRRLRWLRRMGDEDSYYLTPAGVAGFRALGVDVNEVQSYNRRFAYECLDWSERSPHLGGALGAALLDTAIERRWVRRDSDSRALEVTPTGSRELQKNFGILFAKDGAPDR